MLPHTLVHRPELNVEERKLRCKEKREGKRNDGRDWNVRLSDVFCVCDGVDDVFFGGACVCTRSDGVGRTASLP